MGTQPRHRSWKPEHKAIIVGIEMDSWTVHHVWVQSDGGMRSDGRVYYPSEGRTVPGEALVTFGLTSFRIFAASDVAEAAIYAAELEVQLEGFRATLDQPYVGYSLLPGLRISSLLADVWNVGLGDLGSSL